MQNVMLDLETMGVGPRAAIISIGAIEFDPATQKLGRTFYQNVDLASSVACGGEMDADTVMWWVQQSAGARLALKSTLAVDLKTALEKFAQWLSHCEVSYPFVEKNPLLWGNGSDFDNVVLASAYDACGLERPWSFRNNRCYRTLKNLFPDKKLFPPVGGTAHNALDDARWQAQHLLNIFASLKEQA